MDKKDELDVLADLRTNIPLILPFIKEVESYSKFNASSLKPNTMKVFVYFMETKRYGITTSMSSNVRLVLVIKDDNNGDYKLIKAGQKILDNIHKINSNIIERVLIEYIEPVSYEKDNGTWFRFINATIKWKN
ncbi:MAG: hypothetical protein ACRC92_21715 [Peptostreptococcaceae bacterium]